MRKSKQLEIITVMKLCKGCKKVKNGGILIFKNSFQYVAKGIGTRLVQQF
jgi:hypothetical protein